MLGVKMYGNEWCRPGNIVMRQRGTEFHPGYGMGMVRLPSAVEGCIAPGCTRPLSSRAAVVFTHMPLHSQSEVELGSVR